MSLKCNDVTRTVFLFEAKLARAHHLLTIKSPPELVEIFCWEWWHPQFPSLLVAPLTKQGEVFIPTLPYKDSPEDEWGVLHGRIQLGVMNGELFFTLSSPRVLIYFLRAYNDWTVQWGILSLNTSYVSRDK